MAFKMKGNPMKRNFGIGGPAKQSLTDKLYKDKFGTDPHDMAATQEVTPEESATPQRGGDFTAGSLSADPLIPPHKKPHPSEGPTDPQMEGGSPAAQDKFANLANIDLKPKPLPGEPGSPSIGP